jgi:hypothetical protein
MTTEVTCLECGEPIPDSQRLVCSDRCAAVMALVRYGRKHSLGVGDDEVGLDDARISRHKSDANILGNLPTQSLLDKVRTRDRHRCQFDGCGAVGDAVDYQEDDPDLGRRPRASDLRTLCPAHHRTESQRRFVGPLGRIAHTAPATLARIEAVEPLVLRDNHHVWDVPAYLRLLTSLPGPTDNARNDLELWADKFRDLSSSAEPVARRDLDDPFQTVNAAIEQLGWNMRRRRRLVRAILALLLAPMVDESSFETLRARIACDVE